MRLVGLVDDVVELRLEGRQRGGLLRWTELPALGSLLVELRLRGGQDRVLEALDRLARVLCDLRERLAALELLVQLLVRDVQVGDDRLVVTCRCGPFGPPGPPPFASAPPAPIASTAIAPTTAILLFACTALIVREESNGDQPRLRSCPIDQLVEVG
jgi:hypothetical protein